ncbi:MAG TPA: 3-mercaptopyruvate sulfurtransferase [Rhizomicrobium sp.]|jgi:thiosulfate/3-mercaptopyruvate sulfurtransferase
MVSPLVSTEWLAEHLEAPDVRVADASWYLPEAERDAHAEYRAAHIPGAVFFDIDDLSDDRTSLPHMLPPAPKFASRMRKLGLGDGNHIVVYDGAGLFSAARAWWMLLAMGHRDVSVLDGGFPKWRKEGRAVEDMEQLDHPRHFTPRADNSILRSLAQMKANLQTKAEQVIDARGAPRFHARVPEPRPGVRGGHIPGSLNVPYAELLAEDGTMKSPDALRAVFAAHNVDLHKPTVTTCGSGVTAAMLMLALNLVGKKDVALYDGSWAEWGSRDDVPVEAN